MSALLSVSRPRPGIPIGLKASKDLRLASVKGPLAGVPCARPHEANLGTGPHKFAIFRLLC